MGTYRIHMVLPNGVHCQAEGPFPDAFAAIIEVLDAFPAAVRIFVRRLA